MCFVFNHSATDMTVINLVIRGWEVLEGLQYYTKNGNLWLSDTTLLAVKHKTIIFCCFH